MSKNDEEVVIDLGSIIKALWHRMWLIVLVMIICGGVAFAVTRCAITPKYESEVKMYVNNSSLSGGDVPLSISNSEISAAKSLVDTYIVILQSREVINDVIEKAKVNYSYKQMLSMISANPINSTEVFGVVVTSTDPYEAEKIANTIAEVLPGKISEIVEGSSMRILERAVVPTASCYPKVTKNTIIGCLLGFILCAGVITLTVIFDITIRSEEYLLKTYPDIPLLAVVPEIKEDNGRKNGYQKGYYK